MHSAQFKRLHSLSTRWFAIVLFVECCWFAVQAPAQSIYTEAYTFSTFAGEASGGFADGVGTEAQFDYPDDCAADKSGNIFVTDTLNHTIRKITPAGVVTTYAGFPASPGSADGTGSAARFSNPKGVAVDAAGNLYVADTGNSTIRKITTNGNVTTIAGTAGVIGTNDATGAAAGFNHPQRLALDAAGNIYVADTTNSIVRKLTLSGTNWRVTTIAGLAGQTGTNDGIGASARFNLPNGITVDTNGALYVADSYNYTIRKMTLSAGKWTVSTIAGYPGVAYYYNGTNSNARFDRPVGLVLDTSGNLFVTDSENCLIREISPVGTNWVTSTFAGDFGFYGVQDGTGTNAIFDEPRGITIDAEGNLYNTDVYSSCVRKITSASLVSVFAGAADSGGHLDATGTVARFALPYGVALDSDGNVYVADTGNDAIRKISSAGLVITLAGSLANPAVTGTNDGTGTDALFNSPKGVAVDSYDNIYVADEGNDTIRQITPAGVVTTIAGFPGLSGTNDGVGSNARFNLPHTVAVDNNNNVYVADTDNSTIRKMTLVGSNWMVTTIAGLGGTEGTNDGLGSNARLNFPIGLAVDLAANIYVGDYNTFTVRKLTPSGTNWFVSTIAGTPGVQGTADGTNHAALFTGPYGIAVDASGSLYVGDGNAATMRKIIPVGTNWIVSTIAGDSFVEGSYDGIGSNALFSFCGQVAVDGSGNLFVADTGNDTIRKGVFSQFAAANLVSITPPATSGQLQVNLLPAGANGQWRFPWELSWRNNGSVASNLVPGSYAVEFRSLPGYLPVPPNIEGVAVLNGFTNITSQYYPTLNTSGTTNTGGLTVFIGPNIINGSGWRLLGETAWRPSGETVTNLVPDDYFIQFAPVSGFSQPATQAVAVSAGENSSVSVNYILAQTAPVNVSLPAAVNNATLDDLTDYPFGFNGQLLTDAGSGSGVAVQTNAILTAAHLLFNDQTLSYVSQAYWFWQEQGGLFTPDAQRARGWYILSGYAAQRTNDLLGGLVPSESSPQSRNLDVAAAYFDLPVAGGSYGGYLPSDAQPNTWLTSTANKILAGYPVDGSVFGVTNITPGQMYEIGPQPYPLTEATDPVVGEQEVYTANWFLSYPGNSGGPLYVELNGYYYPAGIYLGTLYNGIVPYASLVRGIDSNVVNLINLAADQGTGSNNSGGVILLVPSAGISASNPGRLMVQLGPPAAVAAGAAWCLAGDATYSTASNYVRAITTTNTVSVQFKPVTGWNLPAAQSLTVSPNATTVISANYSVTNPVMQAGTKGISLSGTAGTIYRFDYRTNLTKGSWLPLTIYTIPTNGPAGFFPKPGPGSNVFYRASWLPLGTNAYSVFTNPVMIATAQGVGISGILGTSYVIQSRTNLTKGSWVNISTNQILTNGFNIFLPPPAKNQATFYRAVFLP